jgi:MBG domain
MLTINQATASLALGGLAAIYDGTPKPATALTTPSGINVALTYAGSSTPPSALGSYAVVGTITDSNYLPTTANGTLVISLSSFQSWTSFYNVGAPTDTPQNDGVPNLLKYLYAIDPTQPMTATDQTALPVYGSTIINGTNYLTLTYRQNHNALDLQIQPQSSTDLQSWSPISDSNFPITISTDGNGDLFKQYGVPITGPHQFIRLQVTGP